MQGGSSLYASAWGYAKRRFYKFKGIKKDKLNFKNKKAAEISDLKRIYFLATGGSIFWLLKNARKLL